MEWRPNREEAWKLYSSLNSEPRLIKHSLSVEAAMRGMARHFNEDEELYGVVGLLHDVDFQTHPTAEEHPYAGAKILAENGYPDFFIKAVMGHAPYTGTARETNLEKSLFAVDELAGFVIACALVRPDKSLSAMEIKSVKKRMKDKAFARAVNREDIIQGARELGIELDQLIDIVRNALIPAAAALEINP